MFNNTLFYIFVDQVYYTYHKCNDRLLEQISKVNFKLYLLKTQEPGFYKVGNNSLSLIM